MAFALSLTVVVNMNSGGAMHPAQDHTDTTAARTARKSPGPCELPGIEGFYVLTAQSELGRYDNNGRFRAAPELTASLKDMTERLLHQYRSGDASSLAIGLVANIASSKPWRSATLVFSDAVLREVYHTSDDPDAPLTAFQKRNKLRSMFQGMELVLDTKKASQPQYPRFCPVLFAPEVSSEVLSGRYGIDYVDARHTLEVLDLMAVLDPELQKHSALSAMVLEMRRAKIAPELRHGPGLMLVEDASSGDRSAPDRGTAPAPDASPWEDEPEPRDICFNDGDPVTYWLLAWFAPFNELNDLQRQFVARGHTIMQRPAGTRLIEKGSQEDMSIYLVQGTLDLEAFDGRRMTITGGTRRASLPISQLRPHAYTVTAATEVTVILFSQVMVRELSRIGNALRSRPAIEVHEDVPLPGAESGTQAS